MAGIEDLLRGVLFNERFAPPEHAVAQGVFDPQGDMPPLPPQQKPLQVPPDVANSFAADPGAVPMPRPRPEPAPEPEPQLRVPLTRPQQQPQQPAPQEGGGGLMDLLMGDRGRKIAYGLANGLANLKSSPFALEAAAHGAGTTMQGGNKFDELQVARKQKNLDNAVRMRGQDMTYDIGKRNADSLNAYREGSLGVRGETNDVRRYGIDANTGVRTEANAIKRQANESLASYRERVLKTGNYTMEGGKGQDADGNTVDGAYILNRKTGEKVFEPGMVINRGSGRGGANGTGRQSVFEQKRAAHLAINPGDEQGANDFASGKRPPDPVKTFMQAEKSAKQELYANWRFGQLPPEQQAAQVKQRAQEKFDAYMNAGKQQTQPAQSPTASPKAGGVKPIDRAGYDALPPGASYQHPNDPPGVLRKKKGAPAPVTPDPAMGDEEDDDGA